MHIEVKTEIKHMLAQVANTQANLEKLKPQVDDGKIKKLLRPYMDTIAKMKVWKPLNVAEMFDKMWNELDENHHGKMCHINILLSLECLLILARSQHHLFVFPSSGSFPSKSHWVKSLIPIEDVVHKEARHLRFEFTSKQVHETAVSLNGN
jgi:hypothetical protein